MRHRRFVWVAALASLSCFAACGDDPHDDHDHEHDHHAGGETHGHADLMLDLSATHRAVVDNGRWSAAETWNVKKVPGNGAVVIIPRNITVHVDSVERAELRLVRVRGTLRMEPSVDTSLTVETMVVMPEGRLQIGDPRNPVRAARSATLVFAGEGDVTPTSLDPEAVRRGLIASGEVKLYGLRKTAFVTLAGNARAGAKQLALTATPKGWRRGDRVLIASTHFDKRAPLQNEVRTITDIGTNTITLDSGLAHDHRIDPRMRIHVANLTRNIVFTSASSETKRRGHVMLMNCGGSVVEGTRFENLGRTDKRVIIDENNPRGRYSLHFHQCGLDGGTGLVRNSVVEGTPGWGLAVHSSRADLVNNVVYDFAGAGFVAEDGNELGTFRGNLAAGGRGNGAFKLRRVYLDEKERLRAADFGFHGDGFWLQSPFVQVVDNVAVGNKGAGFFYHCAGLSSDGGVGLADAYAEELGLGGVLGVVRRWRSSQEALVVDFPIVRFAGNTAYGNFIGLKVRYSQTLSNAVINAFDPTRALEADIEGERSGDTFAPYLIESSSFWNNMVGVHASYTRRGLYRSLFVGTDMAPPSTTLSGETWVGYEGWKATGDDMAVDGLAVRGYPVGLLLKSETATTVRSVSYEGVALPIAYNKDSNIR